MNQGTTIRLLLLACLLLLAAPSLEAQRRFPHFFALDSRSLDTLHSPDATSPRHRYRITAWGTYSMWEDTVNSSVDPVWIYSFPEEEWAKPEWRIFSEGYPIYVGDQRLLNSHGLRINGTPLPNMPLDSSHRYSTIIQGDGRPVSVNLVDWNFRDFVQRDAHDNNSGTLYVLVEELPLTEMEICGIDSSHFPTIRVAVKVTRDSIPVENFGDGLRLSENGMPVKIDRIDCSDRTSAVSVAMVFDRSGSMREPFGSSTRIVYTRAAGKKFIEKLSSGDEAAIYSFSLGTTVDQNWTSSKSLLNAAIDRLQPDGWTAMNDAVIRAVNDVSLRAATRRKAIVLLSDGEDNRSQERTIRAVINRAKSAGVPVFAIGLLLDSDDSLRLLASETGGRYFSVRDPAAMDSVFVSIADIIFAQGCCSVYYTSPDSRRDGSFRQVVPTLVFSDDTITGELLGYHAPLTTSSVEGGRASGGASSILGVSPNPLGDGGTVRFDLARAGRVTIDIIDVRGEAAGTIFEGEFEAGEHQLPIDLHGLAAGRYFLRLKLPAHVAIHPVVLVR